MSTIEKFQLIGKNAAREITMLGFEMQNALIDQDTTKAREILERIKKEKSRIHSFILYLEKIEQKPDYAKLLPIG